MNLAPYMAQLNELADPAAVEKMQAYHKVDRPYLGVANPQINDLTKAWRAELSLTDRIALADALWQTDIFEARVAAAPAAAVAVPCTGPSTAASQGRLCRCRLHCRSARIGRALPCRCTGSPTASCSATQST